MLTVQPQTFGLAEVATVTAWPDEVVAIFASLLLGDSTRHEAGGESALPG